MYGFQKSLIPMDAISGIAGSSAWSRDTKLMQKLDGTYRKCLRPHIDTDGSRNSVAKAAWESYCFELGGIFSKHFPDWESRTPFFQDLSRGYECLGPMITSSYVEDMSALWKEVQPALLEVPTQKKIDFCCFVVDSICAGYSLAGAVHRLRTELPWHNKAIRRPDRTRASRARAI